MKFNLSTRPLIACATLATVVMSSIAGAAASDFLGKQQVKMNSSHSEAIFNKALGDLRSVFQNYSPAVDSSTRIVSPLQVSGSSTRPYIEVTMEKCVLLFCKTVELKASVDAQEVSGKCAKNIALTADLARSSEILSSLYSSLDFTLCYNRNQDGTGTIEFSGSARRARSYRGGVVQGEVYNLMKLQVAPISAAIKKTMKTLE